MLNKIFNSKVKCNLIGKKLFSMKSIPIIDLAPLRHGSLNDKKEVGRLIDDANKSIGFFLVKNTGIDFNFVKQTLKVTEDFFLSDEKNKIKSRVDDPEENKPWGFFPRNYEQLTRGFDHDKKEKKLYVNDVNESYNLQNDSLKSLCPKRIFPEHPKDFEHVFTQYWKEAESLANLLMTGFALGLNLNEDYFKKKFDYCSSSLRVLHYPGEVKLQQGQFRASEHTDYGALTALYSTAPGLQVKNRQGEWINVEIPWEHYVINNGDLMAFWTNDRWVSTPHRVVSTDGESPNKRFSLVFFHNPNHDEIIECIPTCKDQDGRGKYENVISSNFIMKKFKASIGEV